MRRSRKPALFVAGTVTISLLAALPTWAQQPIAYVPVNGGDGVKVTGALDVANGRASIGTSGTITAGDSTATIDLARGGQLRLCSTTTLHLTTDRSINLIAQANAASPGMTPTAPSTALLIALDRGALETNYVTGRYSDVVMTPDFRILVSGPGTANLKVRVSRKGDTCVDNHGAGAPYVTVSSQFESGVYRVQPNQRVLFEHGSLHDVVDDEKEPCGCPPPPQVLTAQVALPAKTAPSMPAATTTATGTSSTPASGTFAAPANPSAPASLTTSNSRAPDSTTKSGNASTEFPLAVSEGLAPPPPAQPAPAADPRQVHVQVTVPLAYDGKTGATATAASGSASVPPAPAVSAPSAAPTSSGPAVVYQPAPPTEANSQTKADRHPGVFHRIGHFFSRLFGGG